ncbi:MAG: hypothetical protein DHS20C01_11300 [marine bacterium B5-7]|nr:MAG: hypothetical protein DHS20C01_11300 [marine bacterium B5-7]
MYWALLAVLAILLIVSASRFPKLSFSLLAVLVAVAAGLYYVTDPPGEGLPEKLDAASVEVSNVTMTPYYAGGFRAVGNITNHSGHDDLTDLVIRFSVEDCIDSSDPDAGETCRLLSEVDERVRLHVSPGDTQPFETTVAPRHTDTEGRRRWKFKVVDVKGRKPLRRMDE